MKRLAIAQKVRTSEKYLGVQVRLEIGSTIRWVDVKVPWRLLNEQYEEVANAMAQEAARDLQAAWGKPETLPLEKWE